MKYNNIHGGPKPAELITLPSEMNNHDHEYTQIVIGLNGQAEFDVAGVGNFIGPGQGCVVTASSQHAFGGIGKSDILVLNMPLMTEHDPLILNKLNELGKKDIYFQLDNQIQQLIAMLVTEMRNSPEDELLSRACNDTVVALLQRHLKSFQALQKDARLDMDAVDRYIELHLSHKISVAQLAGSVFLGESQFHMLFKEQTGITPHQYVLGKRIDTAKNLIEQGNLSLGHIAELTGFSGQSTFTHTFSRLQGISPSVYKKRLLNKP
ncbi:helix-turn-helix domain-containing protein [Vibrio sp. SCSIO 43132]|uniref:AraC family transcriptional regulator n=1 Tax=Vibrio sp. SCSIO 43132 TaxID=2779363 RepID=UPI001CA9CD61|nr:AraC family transcriptional regulator [Vibrio sp. SCSIO 43132]UAB73297.1 helix-turn-helix domain-containing protein [Vibrio sp. SCSIO 43132]